MRRGSEQLRAVVCDDRPAARGPLVRLLTVCGFEVPAGVESFSDVPDLLQEHGPCTAVVALPLTGMSGLRAVRALRDAAPTCEVVLLHPSSGLELAAVGAGARALVLEDDLRGLRDVLLDIAGEPLTVRVPGARAQPDDTPTGSVSTKPSS